MRKHEIANGGGGLATVLEPPPLMMGDKLTRDEFMRRWEEHPKIKRAELIGGIVYMPPPLTRQHGQSELLAAGWVGVYHAHTPGTEGGSNATTLMSEDETVQPDVYLRILPEYGGKSTNEGLYVSGASELLTEVCRSSAAYDLHQKLEVYQAAGVQEYLAILLYEQEIRWHRLTKKGYQLMSPVDEHLWKSRVFPGLWLDGRAMLANDGAGVLATLQKGLQSPEHAAFVKKLARKKK